MIRGPFLTLPNVISLLRIPLAVVAVICFALDLRLAAQLLMVASFVTDGIDGAVARLTKTVSEWGRVLDPVADKLVFAILGVAFASYDLIPWWLVITLIGRDVIVASGAALHMGRIGKVPPSNLLGKISTTMIAIYLFKQAFWPADPVALGLDPVGWLATAALLVASLSYVVVYVRDRTSDGPATGSPMSPHPSRVS